MLYQSVEHNLCLDFSCDGEKGDFTAVPTDRSVVFVFIDDSDVGVLPVLWEGLMLPYV